MLDYIYSIIGSILILSIIYILIINSIIIIEQPEHIIIERFGKYRKTLTPGLRFKMPFLDRVKVRHPMRDEIIEIPEQKVFTKDSSTIRLNGVIIVRPRDLYKIFYKVKSVKELLSVSIATELRSIVSKMDLSTAMESRELIKSKLEGSVHDTILEEYGIEILSIKIENISTTKKMEEALENQNIAKKEKEAIRIGALAKAEAQKTLSKSLADTIKEMSDLTGMKPQEVAKLINDREFIRNYKELALSNNKALLIYPDKDTMQNRSNLLFENNIGGMINE